MFPLRSVRYDFCAQCKEWVLNVFYELIMRKWEVKELEQKLFSEWLCTFLICIYYSIFSKNVRRKRWNSSNKLSITKDSLSCTGKTQNRTASAKFVSCYICNCCNRWSLETLGHSLFQSHMKPMFDLWLSRAVQTSQFFLMAKFRCSKSLKRNHQDYLGFCKQPRLDW